MANMELQFLVDELERRRQAKDININLRDSSDPFQLPEEMFRKLYRLTRESAFILFNEMQPHMQVSQRTTKIPNVVRFITAIHFFAHGSYQKSVGKDHHCAMSQAAVSRSVKEVVNIMNNHLVGRYIKFPNNLQEITVAKNSFFEKFNFPGVVGCIDCTHIGITPPKANDPIHPGRAFLNRKGFHSINCQIICDSNLKVIAINAQYPGSVHDSAVWMVSNINTFLSRNYTENNDSTTWLLGDSGYPLQPFLLTSIPGADGNTPEGRYTRGHCRVRNTVERCIGVLKAYFRCLHKDRILHYKPPMAAKIIYCCAVLHNILRSRNIDLEINFEFEFDEDEGENNQNEVDGDLLAQGRAVRNNLIANIFA